MRTLVTKVRIHDMHNWPPALLFGKLLEPSVNWNLLTVPRQCAKNFGLWSAGGLAHLVSSFRLNATISSIAKEAVLPKAKMHRRHLLKLRNSSWKALEWKWRHHLDNHVCHPKIRLEDEQRQQQVARLWSTTQQRTWALKCEVLLVQQTHPKITIGIDFPLTAVHLRKTVNSIVLWETLVLRIFLWFFNLSAWHLHITYVYFNTLSMNTQSIFPCVV